MKYTLNQTRELSIQIAEAIRGAIMNGSLLVDQRLPSEGELCDRFAVSRSTVREALKRLAAQSLIRTQRGATGGAFVNRIRFEDAYPQQITTATLLLSMNDISFETACEARFAAERACVPLCARRCQPAHLATMRTEIHRQEQPNLSDEGFCTSDVAFHKALIEGAGNPVLTYQLASAIEAMQPLMNMITFSKRDRTTIVDIHRKIADGIANGNAEIADKGLAELAEYTQTLADQVRRQRVKDKQNTVRA
ncbi:MAG: GntR family transcriptional regulator [Rhodobacterales bacterium]